MCVVNSDLNDARTLSTLINPGLNTVEYCLNACKDGQFAYAGMEAGAECCTCCLFDELSSPNRISLLQGVAILSNMAERK